MSVWLAQTPADRIEKLSFLVDALFTANGPRNERALSNANIRKALPDAVAIQQAVIHAIEPVLCGDNAQICKQMTIALYRYGAAFWREYERLKAMRGVLDYDDLINRTNRLLDQSDAAQWVAWKLDNGIQHMLIDEAQDTSPQQWQLLRRLIDDFLRVTGLITSGHIASKIRTALFCQHEACLPLVISNNQFIPFRGLTHGLWGITGRHWRHGQARRIKNFAMWRYLFPFGQARRFCNW